MQVLALSASAVSMGILSIQDSMHDFFIQGLGLGEVWEIA